MIDQLRQRLLDRDHPARIHLIGVAGSGMSGLALILLEMGHRVSGSDKVTSTETERLQGLGLAFSSPHTAEAVDGVDVVIYSSAIQPDNPARKAATTKGIPCYRRAECLAAVLNAKKGVIVAGTHGKTTTSSLAAHLLREARLRPCHYVGAEIPVLGANAHWNEQSDHLVAEGDESDGTLVNYIPEHSIVLNIEPEHLDFYRDLKHIKEVFRRLCDQTRGRIIYCAGDAGATDVCSGYTGAISYGWSEADYIAEDVVERRGHTIFTVVANGEALGRVELGVPGRHNVLNALAAIALAIEIGADFASISRGLASFAGARRRFETKYLSPDYRIVDDYGHHPTEIAATLQTARSLKPKRLIVLFQPHRYTRTLLLADDFGKVLQQADKVFIVDIYPASEAPIEGVDGNFLVERIKQHGAVDVSFIPNMQRAHHAVGNALEPGDLLVTLGAGNVHEAGARIAADLGLLEEMLRFAGEGTRGRLYEPMRKHTTMGVGGPAQFWLQPSAFDATANLVNYCHDRNIPVRMVGRGSNIVVRDGGIRGVVIHPEGGEFDQVSVLGNNRISAGANVRLKKLVSVAMNAGIGGFEWMDGIPGSVGGSLRMNAGAMGNDMWHCLRSAVCLDEDGEIREYLSTSLEAMYRSIPHFIQSMVLGATFEGNQGNPDEMAKALEEAREKRKTSQPAGPSAGCIFRNPESIPAGRLIDEMGFKGMKIGGAEVSSVHANFIMNTGNAKAVDITDMVDLIRKRAADERGIELKSEAQFIGDREAQF